MNQEIKIGNRVIGAGHPAYIIAEMSANHAGSIERAKEIIRAAKECGADCVKIQTYTPDTLTIDCHNSYFHIDNGTWEGENLYGLYQKAFTPWEWHQALKEEADRVGIDFLSTPFDNTAVDFLEDLGMSFYKIASFEMVDLPLLRYVASKGKPIIMSTGMGTREEIQEAIDTIYATGNHQLAILKCSSAYPANPADMHLSTIRDMAESFGCPVGLSDHSMGSLSAATAVALGASVIEKHFCISREIENPDASFSMTPYEFKEMVEEIRKVEAALGKPSYGPSEQEKNSVVFRRSIFVVKDIKAGEPITSDNIRVIRPGYGLMPREYDFVLGKTCTADVERGMPLTADLVQDYMQVIEADLSHMDLIYELASDPETRAQSFITEAIPYATHKLWFVKTLENPDRKLYVVLHGDVPVGSYRLDLEGDQAEIGYTVAPGYRHRGYGKELLKYGEKQAKALGLKVLTAQVKKGNAASLKLFRSLGYTETAGDIVSFTKNI